MLSLFSRKKSDSRYKNVQPENQICKQVSNQTYSEVSDIFNLANSLGSTINEQSAMQVSSVYACVALIGGSISSMPLPIYERGVNGRTRVDHDYWWLLNEEPNQDYCAGTMWESMVGSLLLNGDGFIEKLYSGKSYGKITGFAWHPWQRVIPLKGKMGIVYRVYPDPRFSDEPPRIVPNSDMIHVPGPGFNGLHGLSQIKHSLRNAAGIAYSADNYSAQFFNNGGRPDFALKFDIADPGEDKKDMIRRNWMDRYGGIKNSHRPALLFGKADIQQISMNAEDTQLLSTRQFQVEDICRIFGVPPHMVGHTQNNSSWGTGIEQMSIGFVKYTLQRHITKIEQELNRKLWPLQKKYFVEFNAAGLERGDYKTRMEGYRIGLGRAGEPGWMTVNEIRKTENLPPVADGDQLNTGVTNAPASNQTTSAQ